MGAFSGDIFRLLVMIFSFMILIYFVDSNDVCDLRNGHQNWMSPSISDATGGRRQHDDSIYTFQSSFDIETLATVSVIAVEIILATLVKTGLHLKPGLPCLVPEHCLCVLLGLLCGLILCHTCHHKDTDHTAAATTASSLTSGHLLITWKAAVLLLPLLLLDISYLLTGGHHHVYDSCTLLSFCVLGAAVTALCIGASLWVVAKLGLYRYYCDQGEEEGNAPSLSRLLVLSHIISLLNPFALISVLKTQYHIGSFSQFLLLGDSFIGNFLAIIVYHSFKLFCDIGVGENAPVLGLVVSELYSMMSGITSASLGVLCGFVAVKLHNVVTAREWLCSLLIIFMTYLTFSTAKIMHLSGIITLLFYGVSTRKFMELNTAEEKSNNRKSARVMKIFSYLNETVIYTFMGLYLLVVPRTWNTSFMLLTLLLCVLYRTVGWILQSVLANHLHMLKVLPLSQAYLSYNAIRGVCALSLASLLDDNVFPQKQCLATTVVMVIIFTVFLQGTILQSILDFLQLSCGKPQKKQSMEPVENTAMHPIVGPIQNIANCHDEREFRQKMVKVGDLYLKPVFLHVQTLKSLLLSFIEMYANHKVDKESAKNGLSANEASQWPEQAFTKLSAIQPKDLKSSLSESDLTKNDRHHSIPMPDATSNTCLDLAALEAMATRKMKDDSKIHHLMEGITFKHTIRVLKSKRHSEPEPDMDEDHHHARYHLRKLLNPVYHEHQHGHHSYSLGVHRHSKKDIWDVINEPDNTPADRPRKNVSFADQSEIAEAIGLMNKEARCITRTRRWSENDDNDVGITFTVPAEKLSAEKEIHKVRTAVESLLPWKRNTGREPVSSSLTHSLPEDDKPPVSEAPYWVLNDSCCDIPGVCLEDIYASHLSQGEGFTSSSSSSEHHHHHQQQQLNGATETSSESRSSHNDNSSSSRHSAEKQVHTSEDELPHNLGNFQFVSDENDTNSTRNFCDNKICAVENYNEGDDVPAVKKTEEGVRRTEAFRSSRFSVDDGATEFSWMRSFSSHDDTTSFNVSSDVEVNTNILPAPWKTKDDSISCEEAVSLSRAVVGANDVAEVPMQGLELPLPWKENPEPLPSPATPHLSGCEDSDKDKGATLPPPWQSVTNGNQTQEETRSTKSADSSHTHNHFIALHRTKSQSSSDRSIPRFDHSKTGYYTEVTDQDSALWRSNSCPMETSNMAGVVHPPPWRSNSIDQFDSSASLPPPWRSNGNDHAVQEEKSAILPPPWKTNHDSQPEQEFGAIPPPPWRSNSDPADLPVRSPSASQDIDYCSIRPQASQQSFKLSEAESKHSEQISIPQIMEMPPRFYVEGDISEGDSDDEDNVYLADEMDFTERIEQWLVTTDPMIGPFDDEWEEFNRHFDDEDAVS